MTTTFCLDQIRLALCERPDLIQVLGDDPTLEVANDVVTEAGLRLADVLR